MLTHDIVVIGSGSAGQRTARQAAKLGKCAAVVERQRVVAFENSSGIGFHTGATWIMEGK